MAKKKTDSQKLDQIITMISDVVDVFGKRFDRVDERFDKLDNRIDGVEKRLDNRIDGAIVKIDGVQNTLDREAQVRADQKLPERVDRIEKHLSISKKIAA